MLKLHVKIDGLDIGEKKTKIKLQTILMKCMFKMEDLAVTKAPADTTELREKITLFPQILSNRYTLVSGAKYSAPMEYGTRPFYAPIAPLSAWAKRKLGDEKLGYAVRAKIAKFGITAHPYMRPAFYEVKDFWVDQYIKQELQ